MEVTDFVLERKSPEEHPKSDNPGLVSELGHNVCKPKNIAIGTLK